MPVDHLGVVGRRLVARALGHGDCPPGEIERIWLARVEPNESQCPERVRRERVVLQLLGEPNGLAGMCRRHSDPVRVACVDGEPVLDAELNLW